MTIAPSAFRLAGIAHCGAHFSDVATPKHDSCRYCSSSQTIRQEATSIARAVPACPSSTTDWPTVCLSHIRTRSCGGAQARVPQARLTEAPKSPACWLQVRDLTVECNDEAVPFEGYERVTEAPPPAGAAIFVLFPPYSVLLHASSTSIPGSAVSSCCRMAGESSVL